MDFFHFRGQIVSRAKGKSALAMSAYRAASKLRSDYDGLTRDFRKKFGVYHSEVMLPENAPREYLDREKLWNSVELIEKSQRAQLAREFNMALPRSIPLDKNARMISEFVRDMFVSRGMCADVAIHDNGTGNPHAHVMLTMRSMDDRGNWLPKSEKVYLLDRHGRKQYDPKKKQYKCTTRNINDWNDRDNIERWREAYCERLNQAFREHGLSDRLDHRSYERQGIDRVPTFHVGHEVTNLEKRGVRTDVMKEIERIKQDNRDREKKREGKRTMTARERLEYISQREKSPNNERLKTTMGARERLEHNQRPQSEREKEADRARENARSEVNRVKAEARQQRKNDQHERDRDHTRYR